jgi:GntR family galactonate operon transcriptional repressor
MDKNIFPPPRKQALHRGVARTLALRLVEGKVAAGETLPTEDVLCTQFSVSRTVVREAVRVLIEKRMVQPRRRTGTIVLPADEWDLTDPELLAWRVETSLDHDFVRSLLDVRSLLEPAAAALAATRGTAEEIAAIVGGFEQMKQTVADREAFIAADMVFHRAIFLACHNPFINRMAAAIESALIASRKLTTRLPENSELSIPLHEAVARAISRRSAPQAERAMRTLVTRAAEDVETLFRKSANLEARS